MSQAGRYLPEYRALRTKHSLSFLFHDPHLAADVTLLPLKRFPLDAAIVFSDLLLIAEVWDKEVVYPDSGGPYISPAVETPFDLFLVTEQDVEAKLSYVLQTIEFLLPALSVPLLGFCGAPFTLLCYLLEGKAGHDFSKMRSWLNTRASDVHLCLDRICDVVIAYVRLQIKAGVEAVQIFDSWANLLSKEEFLIYALPYWKKIQQAIVEAPLIFFSRANSLYPNEVAGINPNVISFDEGKDLGVLRDIVPSSIAIQGNFSPTLLATASFAEVREKAKVMAQSVKGKAGIIFNLGHGILPHTPVENVSAFLEGIYDT
jgi:uroporphyrinogen decarboxylase